jgi:hypothetical protein
MEVIPEGTTNVKVPPEVYSVAPPVVMLLLAELGGLEPSPLLAVTVNV